MSRIHQIPCPLTLSLIVLIVCSVSTALANPNIGNVSIASEKITIAGTGFGTKTKAAPFVWDDFEDGTNGSQVGTSPKGIWTLYNSNTCPCIYPIYSTTAAYSGSFGAKKTGTTAAHGGEEFTSYYINGLNSDEMYYSIMFKWTVDAGSLGSTNPVMKLARLGTQPDPYTSNPHAFETLRLGGQYIYADGVTASQSNIKGETVLCSNCATPNVWHRLEAWYKLSTPGVADGFIRFDIDGINRVQGTWDNVVTRDAAGSAQRLDSAILPMMVSSNTNMATLSFYADDVYVDNTRARVEICTGTTWASRGHCEIQIPSAWSELSITATVHRGKIADISTAYLYVIDHNGLVNSSGYPVNNSGTDKTPPNAPSGLRVL